MHTLARSPVRETSLKSQARLRAFTLIELLTVIAIIAILAAITFGVVKGVNERAAIGQAKAELSSIAQALEAYKQQYGDYPQTGSFTPAGVNGTPNVGSITSASAQAVLLNALVGKAGPKGNVLRRPGGRTLIEISKFALETADLPALEPTPVTSAVTLINNALLDPWGRRYMYFYKNKDTPSAWRGASYILYSAGPDGLETNGTNTNPISTSSLNFKEIGVLNPATLSLANNADNIWAN
jgi:prepilin-type N-terminal cleavage/methylation domain-containing protein